MSRWAYINIGIYFKIKTSIKQLQQLNPELTQKKEIIYTFKNKFKGSEGNSNITLDTDMDKLYIQGSLRDIDWYWDKEIIDPFRVLRNDFYEIIKKWISIIDYVKCEIKSDDDTLFIDITKDHKWYEQTIYEYRN